MARIHEEHIVIKLSKIAGDNEAVDPIVNADVRAAILEIAKELLKESLGDHVIVEAVSDD